MRTLEALLDKYDLEPGDIVRIDAGDYVTIRTASPSVGSTIVPMRLTSRLFHSITLQGALHGHLENLHCDDDVFGLDLRQSDHTVARHILITDAHFNGVYVYQCANLGAFGDTEEASRAPDGDPDGVADTLETLRFGDINNESGYGRRWRQRWRGVALRA